MYSSKSNLNKKCFGISTSITPQELKIVQLLQHLEIPFLFQQKFQLSDRYYILDFFIDDSILLECSFTSMYKVDVALKLKALQLEAKFVQLKKKYNNSFWVLFEAIKPINTHLLTTLQRLMPSVNVILTSRNELLEKLREFLLKHHNSNEVNAHSSVLFSFNSVNDPIFAKYCTKSFHKSSKQNYCPYNIFKINKNRQLLQQPQNSPFIKKDCLFKNYSHKLNKKFEGKSEVFKS